MKNEDIKSLEGLIYKIAYTFTDNKSLIDDLYQQGVLGVLKAKKNFNCNLNVKFSTYAKMYIYGEIYEYFNSINKPFKINKDIIRLYSLINKTKVLLTQELNREPDVTDISKYLNIDEENIINTLSYMQTTLSINYEYEDSSLENTIKTYDSYLGVEVGELIESLTNEQQRIIFYKYFDGYSQEEIAKLMHMSQSSVSRGEKEGLQRMRKKSHC